MGELEELEEIMLEATTIIGLRAPITVWAMWKKLPKREKREIRAAFIKMVMEAYKQKARGR